MSNIFYYGDNDTIHGPVTEQDVQRWYINSYFSSDVKFQISSSGKFDPNDPIYTLGELIDLNGRANPFYFSSERANREKKMKEDLAQLIQKVESLTNKNNLCTHPSEKNTIDVLKTQIATLVKSNADLQDRVDALSKQRETSPVTPQLEKKVTDLKKRVDEQEKNVVSIKKEISTLNSKCDRNESKLDKMMAKQNKTEETVKGYDKRITDLKAAEESLRASVSTCEETSGKVDLLEGRVDVLVEEMESLHGELSTDRAELRILHEDLDKVQKDLKELRKNEKELRSEIKSVKEETKKPVQVQHVIKDDNKVERSAPVRTESGSVPPWEMDRKKAAVPAEGKEQKVLPWEAAAAKKEEDKAPFGDDKAASDAGARKKQEVLPWEGAEAKKEEKEEDKDAGDGAKKKKQEALPWEGAEARKENSAPFGDDKAAGGAGADELDDLPWNRRERKKEKESAPWESREEPPWTTGSGKISAKKDTVVQAEQAGNGLSIEQRQGKAAEVPAKSADVKPVSQAKDWNAICRELSDDEEEEAKKAEATADNLTRSSGIFVHDTTQLLQLYCSALDNFLFVSLELEKDMFDYDTMRKFYSECCRTAPHYGRIREAILEEVRRLAATTVFCSACNFTMTTPRQLFYHFTDAAHVKCQQETLPLLGAAFFEMSDVIAGLFFHFIESTQELDASMSGERALNARGERRLAESTHTLVLADLRPTQPFMIKVVGDVTSLAATHYTAFNTPTESIPTVDLGKRKKEVASAIKAHFECRKRKRKFEKEFEQHVAEGIPACACCRVRFERVDEYYQHVTTYDHALKDQSIFGLCMWIWKGHEYWDAML